MPKKCEDCSSYLFCMSVAEVNEEDFETMANKRNCKKRVFTNADRIRAMSDEERRKTLIDYFSKWAGIGDSYIFDLIRVKKSFAVGTISFDDFKEWDEFRIAELVDELIEWLQQPVEGE